MKNFETIPRADRENQYELPDSEDYKTENRNCGLPTRMKGKFDKRKKENRCFVVHNLTNKIE